MDKGVLYIVDFSPIRSNGEILLPSALLELLNLGFYVSLHEAHSEKEALLPDTQRRGRFLMGLSYRNEDGQRVAVSIWEDVCSFAVKPEMGPVLQKLFGRKADARFSRKQWD